MSDYQTSLKIGDRVIGRNRERGTIVETGIRMRDARDCLRIAVKVDLDGGPSGAYRYLDTVRKVGS